MPLTQEQFNKAKDSGFTTDQIIAFEKKRQVEMPQQEQQQETSTRDKRYLVTPEEYQNRHTQPFLSALGTEAKYGYQERIAPMVEGASSAAFGLPRAALHKMNPDLENAIMPEQISAEGKGIRGVSEAFGLARGGAMKVAGNVGKKIIGNTLGKNIMRGATEGAVAGGSQFVNPDVNLGQQAMQAAGGVVVGATIPLVKNMAKSFYNATKGEADFGDKVMSAFQNKKIEAIKKWDKDVDLLITKNPDKTSGESLVPVMKEAQAIAAFDERLNSAINTNEQLRKLVQNPELARNMPIKEVQSIVTKLNAKIQGKYGPNYIELKDFIHDVKTAQLDAFPEMAEVKENYANIAEPYRLIKSKIKEGNILKNLANKFGDAQLNRRAESLMTTDLKKEVDSYRRTKKLLQGFGQVATSPLTYGAGAATAGLLGAFKK